MRERYFLLIAGLVVVLYSIIYLQNLQVYNQMLCFQQSNTRSQFYLPYLLFGFGTLLVSFPLIEPILKNRSFRATDHSLDSSDEKSTVSRMKLVEKLLNKDEARILKIIFENEGITQDSLHFRTGFSHSKISMVLKKLEEKDLIIRERFGRTYRLYPGEQLEGIRGES
jgi:hypothetical protein